MQDVENLAPMVTERLAAAGCIAADEEAAELMAAAPDAADLESWLCRREQGEPLAWITGSVRFCGHEIRVEAGVFVPRPQSEELARRATRLLALGRPEDSDRSGRIDRGDRTLRAVDLCTGTGAVAVHLKSVRPDAAVIGVDVDPQAVACARANGVPAVLADLADPVELDPPLRSGCFDVVTAVPPYVPTGELHLLPADVQRYEPWRSLDGGSDGLGVVRRLVASAAGLLRPGGWLMVELGADQDVELAPTLAASGFAVADRWTDDEGDLRGIAARLDASPPGTPSAR